MASLPQVNMRDKTLIASALDDFDQGRLRLSHDCYARPFNVLARWESDDAGWPCPNDFPFADADPLSFCCYDNETFARRREGPCGSWCVVCAAL